MWYFTSKVEGVVEQLELAAFERFVAVSTGHYRLLAADPAEADLELRQVGDALHVYASGELLLVLDGFFTEGYTATFVFGEGDAAVSVNSATSVPEKGLLWPQTEDNETGPSTPPVLSVLAGLAIGAAAVDAFYDLGRGVRFDTNPILGGPVGEAPGALVPDPPLLSLSADTGRSDSDGVTSDARVSVTASEAVGSLEYVLLPGRGSSLVGDENWLPWVGASTLSSNADGPYTLYIRQIDDGGNVGAAATINLTLDTLAPVLAINDPLVSDNIVNGEEADAVTVSGTGELGEVVALVLTDSQGNTVAKSVLVDASGNWSVSVKVSELSEGMLTVTASVTDTAGNTATATRRVTLDTDAPTAPTLSLVDDTGSSDSDGVTSDVRVIVTPAETGGRLEYVLLSGLNKALVGTESWTTLPVSALTAMGWAPTTQDGEYSLYVRQVDAAGNVGISAVLDLTLDTLAPALTIDVPLASDNVINSVEADAVTLSGTSEAGAVVNVTLTDSQSNIVSGSVLVGEDGSWSVDLDARSLNDGNVTVSVVVTDTAINTATATRSLTLDTAAPTAPTLSLEDDTGSSDSDGVTADARVIVTLAEVGGSLEYVLLSGRGSSLVGGETWSAWVDENSLSSIADGSYTLYIRQVDAAGNAGAASSLDLTLDAAAPTAPTLSLVDDTGSDGTDGVTSDARVTVTPAESGGRLEYVLLLGRGSSLVGDETWSALPSSALTDSGWSPTSTDNSYTLYVRQVDAAGNEGASTSLDLTRDTEGPTAPTVTLVSDTGLSDSDGVTSDVRVTVSPAETGGRLEYVLLSGRGTSLAGGDIWSAWVDENTLSSIADGSYTLHIRQVDAAGNEGASASLDLTRDTVPPAIVVFDLVAGTSTDYCMRTFQDDTEYHIYVVVDSTRQAVKFTAGQQWSNAAGLDEDDKITLISAEGRPIYGGASQYGNVDFVRLASGSLKGSAYSWGVDDNMAFRLFSDGAATRANGRLPYSTLSVPLWTDQWSALTADQFHYSDYWVTLTDGQDGQVSVDGNAIYTTDPAAFGLRENPAGLGWDVEFSVDDGTTWVTNFADLSLPDAYGTHSILVRQVNAGQSITSDTLTYTFDIVPEAVPPEIVIFDLVQGRSSNHSSRIFDANTSYEIYIIVDDNDHTLNFDSLKAWRGGDQLGADDFISLVSNGGIGNPLIGAAGGYYSGTTTTNSDLLWFTSSGTGVLLDNEQGLLHRYVSGQGSSAALWTGQWQAAPTYSYTSSVTAGIPVSFAF